MARRKTHSNVPVINAPVVDSPAAAQDAGFAAEGPKISRRAVKAILGLILIVFVVLGLMYSALTPAATADQHNPDENAHMLYVASAAAGHLPVFHAGDPDYEAHQPPLYYALCAPVYALARANGPAAATRAVRGVSLLLGAALAVVVFLCVSALLPTEPLLALGAAAFAAWLPMNLALSASVTNDALTDLVVALVLWRLTLLARAAAAQPALPPRLLLRHACVLGLLIGLGIWTKTSTLLMLPTVAGACYFLVKQRLLSTQEGGRVAAVSLGLGLLLGAPWLLRNQLLYGDPLAQHLFETAFQNTAQAPDLIRYVFGGSIGAYLWGVAQWTFASFWGVFDSMRLFWGQSPHAHPPSPAQPLPLIYQIIGWICLAVLGSFLFSLRRGFRWAPWQTAMVSSFGVLVALTWLAHLRFVLVFFQAQGRYWYPALLPLSLFFVLGWRGLLPQPQASGLWIVLLAAGLLALNALTLGVLLPGRFAP